MSETGLVGVGELEPSNSLSIMLTRRCNMTCAHCSVKSGPKVREEPTDAELVALVHSAADSGIRSVQITGGEPMLREKLVLDMLRAAKKRGMFSSLSTNGFWGKNPAKALSKTRLLKRAGLRRMVVSYDRYHAEFQGPEPALNIARAAEWFEIPISINVTRVTDDPELAGLVAPFEKRHHLKMRFYDVQVIGRARELPLAEMRGETSGFCNACGSAALTDDGRMTACNGPSYFVEPGSPLAIGSTRDTPMRDLLDKHSNDVILETIRRAGPSRLLRELQDGGVADKLGIRDHHSGICDLCLDINSNPEAVGFLRERLAAPKFQAELTARRMVIMGGQEQGTLKLPYVNGMGAGRLWMNAAAGKTEKFAADAERIIGRADFDWKRNLEYLARCGVARGLTGILDHPQLKRWAPSFFVERVREAAGKEAMLELAQREILRRLEAVLSQMSERGVLLKGAAILALDMYGSAPAGTLPRRSAGDVDIVVPEKVAAPFREQLLSAGFSGSRVASRTGAHHLAPVSFHGISVEIHTSIMPESWGLPENEMLEHARTLSGTKSLATLDTEGMILHAFVHSTAHLYSHGLRAAWDANWLLERFGAMDTERLLRWVKSLAMPRSFWVPARILSKEVVPLPPSFMQHAPTDERQRWLEVLADLRLFSALEGAFDLNPISRNGHSLMLHDSLIGRARHLVSLLGREEREARRSAALSARLRDPTGERSALAVQIHEGMIQLKQFQRAISR